jgi:hypothetical protein
MMLHLTGVHGGTRTLGCKWHKARIIKARENKVSRMMNEYEIKRDV